MKYFGSDKGNCSKAKGKGKNLFARSKSNVFAAIFFLISLAFLALLASCTLPIRSSSAPSAANNANNVVAHSVSYRGRFAVRYEEVESQTQTHKTRSVYGHFEWHDNGNTLTLQLLDPLGQTLARILSSPSGATLELPHRPPQTADNVEELMWHTLGFALPISSLCRWLQSLEADQQPVKIQQDGWTIDEITSMTQRANSAMRVTRVHLMHENPSIEVKLVIE